MINSTSHWAHHVFDLSVRISESQRHLPYHWDREAEAAGRRERVYCGLHSDPFDPAVTPTQRLELWCAITNTINLDWVLVTSYLTEAAEFLASMYESARMHYAGFGAVAPSPLPNLCIGAYVSNQDQGEARIPALAEIQAAAHSIHCEPLLGALDLSVIDSEALAAVDWIICDVHEAITAHPFSKDWAMELRAQCILHNVGFYSRQLRLEMTITDQLAELGARAEQEAVEVRL
jgi:protein gp37